MTAMQTWTFPPHSELPPGGPWVDEPDKAQWVDPDTDLDCLLKRNHFGALCGYVGVPPGHPWHGKDYGHIDAEVEVHGGLTFSDACHEGRGEDAICHVPAPGRPADVWWLGFDCGHYMDVHPLLPWPGDFPSVLQTYKTVAYVKAECARLAAQIAAVA
jgi:hypothetical protein